MNFPAERAAGWCKADRNSFEPPPGGADRNLLGITFWGVSSDGGLPLKRIGVGIVRIITPVACIE